MFSQILICIYYAAEGEAGDVEEAASRELQEVLCRVTYTLNWTVRLRKTGLNDWPAAYATAPNIDHCMCELSLHNVLPW